MIASPQSPTSMGGLHQLPGKEGGQDLPTLPAAAEWRAWGTLNRWVRNPRKNAEAVPRVAKSIQRFGFVAPIVVWLAADRMVAGDTRLQAMAQLMAEDPTFTAKGAPGPGLVRVVFHDFENEHEADLYALADNRLQELTAWDEEGVDSILSTYDAADRELAGFEEVPVQLDDEPEQPPATGHAETRKLGSWSIVHGDVETELPKLEPNSFDALMCDSPYGLSFMGKKWDYDVPSATVWAAALEALKPGAPLVNFSATRTYHRMVVAVEDGGFEIRDMLSWLYGQGFPKSLDIGKGLDDAAGVKRKVVGMGAAQCEYIARGKKCPGHGDVGRYGETVHVAETVPATAEAKRWDGYGTALKPACEPAVLARKPLDGTVVQNVKKWGVGGLWIDGGSIASDSALPSVTAGQSQLGTFERGHMVTPERMARFPSNVMLDPAAAAMLDAQSGNRPSTLTGRADPNAAHANPSDAVGERMVYGGSGGGSNVYADDGGASRFFYVAKASRREREEGTLGLPRRTPAQMTSSKPNAARLNSPRTGAGRGQGARNFHPTVKPVSLARQIATLLLPPPRADGKPRRILVPYSGSGSEMIGALLAGWDEVVGIERDAEYLPIARARVGHAVANPRAWEPQDEPSEVEVGT